MKKLTAALIICFFVLSGMAITVNAVNLGSYTGTVGTQYSKKDWIKFIIPFNYSRIMFKNTRYNVGGLRKKPQQRSVEA